MASRTVGMLVTGNAGYARWSSRLGSSAAPRASTSSPSMKWSRHERDGHHDDESDSLAGRHRCCARSDRPRRAVRAEQRRRCLGGTIHPHRPVSFDRPWRACRSGVHACYLSHVRRAFFLFALVLSCRSPHATDAGIASPPSTSDASRVVDLAGWRRQTLPDVPSDVAYFVTAPDWVCEVLSASPQALDRSEKMDVYARERVGHAWLVDPSARTLEVYRLRESRWERVGVWHGDVVVRAEPFDALELDLAGLWRP